jgi:hypothetical protein
MSRKREKRDTEMLNLIFGVEAILNAAWGRLFLSGYQEDQIEGVTLVSVNERNIGLEVCFSSAPSLSMFADVVRIPIDSGLPEVRNLFRLLPTSLAVNRFLGVHQCTHLGVDVLNNAGAVLDLSTESNTVYKAGQPILTNPDFTMKKLKLYFINQSGFVNPSIVVRILGAIVPDFLQLLLTSYKRKLENFSVHTLNHTPNYTVPGLLGLTDFIEYLDNLTENEDDVSKRQRNLFLRGILTNEYSRVNGEHINIDFANRFFYINKQEYSGL